MRIGFGDCHFMSLSRDDDNLREIEHARALQREFQRLEQVYRDASRELDGFISNRHRQLSKTGIAVANMADGKYSSPAASYFFA